MGKAGWDSLDRRATGGAASFFALLRLPGPRRRSDTTFFALLWGSVPHPNISVLNSCRMTLGRSFGPLQISGPKPILPISGKRTENVSTLTFSVLSYLVIIPLMFHFIYLSLSIYKYCQNSYFNTILENNFQTL